jgi:hypothetical protein
MRRSSFSLVPILLLILLTALLIIAAPSLVAAKIIQQSQSRVAQLTNQDVIKLLQTKLTQDEIIAKIRSSPSNFETSVPEIRLLKDAGVSDKIIAAMIQVEKTASISGGANAPEAKQPEQIVVPAGTHVDVEAAYTVSSLDVQAGDLISFRVLVPIKINGVVVVDKGALVTARVIEAKRGGHWGKAGRLSWTMQDVVAVDSRRVPLQSGAEAGSDEINNAGSPRGQPVWGAGNPEKCQAKLTYPQQRKGHQPRRRNCYKDNYRWRPLPAPRATGLNPGIQARGECSASRRQAFPCFCSKRHERESCSRPNARLNNARLNSRRETTTPAGLPG